MEDHPSWCGCLNCLIENKHVRSRYANHSFTCVCDDCTSNLNLFKSALRRAKCAIESIHFEGNDVFVKSWHPQGLQSYVRNYIDELFAYNGFKQIEHYEVNGRWHISWTRPHSSEEEQLTSKEMVAGSTPAGGPEKVTDNYAFLMSKYQAMINSYTGSISYQAEYLPEPKEKIDPDRRISNLLHEMKEFQRGIEYQQKSIAEVHRLANQSIEESVFTIDSLRQKIEGHLQELNKLLGRTTLSENKELTPVLGRKLAIKE